MNILEAVKHGLPFRRPDFKKGWYWWLMPMEGGKARLVYGYYPQMHVYFTAGPYNTIPVSVEALQADDWELRHPEVTITSDQFWEAVTQTDSVIPHESKFSTRYLETLAKNLGLE